MTSRLISPIEGVLDSTVSVPGSKSLTNRALVIAAMANGTSTLHGIGRGDDVEAMLSCLTDLGASLSVVRDQVSIEGLAGSPLQPAGAVDARMSGTTARFIAPLLHLCGGTITGHEQMQGRPMGELTNALRDLGSTVDADQLPFSVLPPKNLPGTATHGPYQVSVPANVSSQFISGLLILGPLLGPGLQIEQVGRPVSQSYVSMTISVMEAFGAVVTTTTTGYAVAPTGYTATRYDIEPDASTASYPLAAAAIVGGRIRVRGLGRGSLQSDAKFANLIESMGAAVDIDDDYIEVRGSGELRAIHADLAECSDTAPTFAALAARATGRSEATGIGFIRSTKESDRVAGSVAELSRLGVVSGVDDDGFHVVGGPHVHAEVETYEDHRMAMAFALLGLVEEPVSILDPECVAKTFPDYWQMLDQMRAESRLVPDVLAIDGPAGAGKSTVTQRVAERLRLPYLDTGAMYRSMTLLALRSGLSLDDEAAIANLASAHQLTLLNGVTLIDGEDVSDAIRTPEVTRTVSAVAAIGALRTHLVAGQRIWVQRRGAGVLEGRDIGTAVFPEATLKIYLTATAAERARRRAAETGDTNIEQMTAAIEARDLLDSTRETDPLRQADDAVALDSSDMTIDEVVDEIIRLWQNKTGSDAS